MHGTLDSFCEEMHAASALKCVEMRGTAIRKCMEMRGTMACVGMQVAWTPTNCGASAQDWSGKPAGSAA